MARERIEMSIQNDILNYKNQGKKQRQIARLLGINRETVARYWNGPPEEVAQELEWVAPLNWDYITDQIEHGVPRKILYEELALENCIGPRKNETSGHLKLRGQIA